MAHVDVTAGLAGENREHNHGTDFPVSPADTAAELMIKKARIDLALLQRFAERLSHMPEGQIYLRLIEETAAHAVDYAISHCIDKEKEHVK